MERGFSGTYSGRCLPTWTFRILFSVESAFPQITIVSCGKTRRVSGIRHRRQILGFAFATGHTFRIAPRRQNVDHLRAWRPEREKQSTQTTRSVGSPNEDWQDWRTFFQLPLMTSAKSWSSRQTHL